MFKHSLYPGSYLARIILPIPATHFEKTTFLSGPKYMEDPVLYNISTIPLILKGIQITIFPPSKFKFSMNLRLLQERSKENK